MADVKLSDDTISQGALLFISQGIQPKNITWAAINPEKPIFNKFKEFQEKRMLVHNDGKFLRLFVDSKDDW